jgi:hypothetical protein
MKISFDISQADFDKAIEWYKGHDCPAKQAWLEKHGDLNYFPGPFGGGIAWILRSTTVGDMIDLACDCCDAKLEDVTDLAGNF